MQDGVVRYKKNPTNFLLEMKEMPLYFINHFFQTMLLYIWLAVALAAVWMYCRQIYSRFSKTGLKHFRPVPLLGNMTRQVFQLEHFVNTVEDLYKAFPEERYVGTYTIGRG